MPTDLPPDWIPEEERRRRASLVSSARAVFSACNWLYWVAGITVVNALLPLFGKQPILSLGLGTTRIADELFRWFGVHHPALTVAAGLLAAAFVAGLGYLGRRQPWALGLAVAVMVIDSSLFFALGRFSALGIFFRLWVIGALVNGLLSLQRLRASIPAS